MQFERFYRQFLFFALLLVFITTTKLFAQIPVISALSLNKGPVGTSITITGSSFNATLANNLVRFGPVKATVSAITGTTQLTVTVPAGSGYQPVTVTNLANHLTGASSIPFVTTFTSHQSIGSSDIDPNLDFGAGKNPTSAVIADVDDDNAPDVIVINATGSSLSVLSNRATGSSITSSSFVKTDFATNSNPTALAVGDFNGDGKPDLAVVYQGQNVVSILLNTNTVAKTPSFSSKTDYAIGGTSRFVAIADVDKDGLPDVLTANFAAGSLSVLRNITSGGTTNFAANVDFMVGTAPNSISVADIDQDGKSDILVSNFGSKTISIFKNSSTPGAFISTSLAAKIDIPVTYEPTAVFSVNVDIDAYPDLVIANFDPVSGANYITLKRNLMTAPGSIVAGSFAAGVNISTGSQPVSLAAGDIDGDGVPDLVAADYNGKTISVFRNTATITGITSSTLAPKIDFQTGNTPYSLTIGDVDMDGKPDLVTANDIDNTVSVLHNYNATAVPGPAYPASTAAISTGSFISADIMDNEWKQEPPVVPGLTYTLAGDNGTTISATTVNAGRFVYFGTMGSQIPSVPVRGTLTFSAQGTGTIEVLLIATSNMSIQARKMFTMTAAFTDYGWNIPALTGQTEYVFAVIFNGGTGGVSTASGSAQFKKNMCLTLQQGGMTGYFNRYRADATSLIGNTETGWYGFSDAYNAARKKYLQHSAYARMRFQTDATQILIEYVRDFYDKRVVNLFPAYQSLNNSDWVPHGFGIQSGNNSIDSAVRVIPGKTYTISGLLTTSPSYVFYNNGTPLDTAKLLTVIPGKPGVYTVTAPASATNLALLVQRITDANNLLSPLNDTYLAYANTMVQEGAIGSSTPYDGIIPSAQFIAYGGHTPSHISGPAIFINGKLYNYYQVEGSDIAKVIQFVSDVLPAGMKTVEIMMPGQGTYLPTPPATRRGGTFLRAVYFPASSTTIVPSTTVAPNSITYIHDSILSGFNISSNAQNNVWMMKTLRDSTFGFTGDIYSEGYAGRILHTDTQTPTLLEAFAQKLAAFKTDKYWFQIGVNDYGFNTPLTNFYTEYKTLIERLKVLRTGGKFYIQSTGPEFFEGANTETYTDDLLSGTGPTAGDFRDVQRALGTSHNYTEYVDFETLFSGKDAATVSDGIHPTDQGNTIYALGIKQRSTLLGGVQATSPLSFFNRDQVNYTIRPFIKGVPGISIITAQSGTPPYVFSLVSGIMPGLTLNPDGVITGTATTASTYPITVKVADAAGANVTRVYNLLVKPAPPIIVAPLRTINAKKDSAYNFTVNGANGYAKYKVTLASGTLPTGLTLDTLGNIHGTPTATGVYTFNVSVKDHWNFTAALADTIRVGTGSPPLLTENWQPTLDISSGNIMVNGHVHDYYNATVFMFVGAGVFQTGGSNYFNGGLVDVNPGSLSSGPVNLGHINPALGSVTQVILFMSSSALNLYQLNSKVPVKLTYPSSVPFTYP
ncbi:VCBS repeat-containing protein [Mucilaginibacter sp. BJC16-A38]|uniref:FG-GAP-like repeat-containing protein n=1 Tax=Mucilaginibacter phenanthrenivorans TaxID=1234842 RepID=UPI002157C08B|nr:FG-GAP-like repeat-containing protein [Mucilaginibacter phenanthrenivorans]MCR8558147.1 VCBS repeat-containing protein [Mucilaginibacter phenanthrenivorans]